MICNLREINAGSLVGTSACELLELEPFSEDRDAAKPFSAVSVPRPAGVGEVEEAEVGAEVGEDEEDDDETVILDMELNFQVVDRTNDHYYI